MRFRAAAIGGAIVLSLVWFQVLRGPHPDPSEDIGQLEAIGLLVLCLVAGASLICMLIAAVVRDWRWTRRFGGLLLGLFAPIFVGGGLSDYERYQWDLPTIREVEDFAAELKDYRARNGAYPDTLRALQGLPAAPELTVRARYEELDYSTRDDHFVIGFSGPSRWYRYLTDDGWVSDEPHWMYPLSAWASGTNY